MATVVSLVPPRYTSYDVAPETGVHVNETWVSPAVADTPLGVGRGGATGVALAVAEGADAGEFAR